MRAIFTFGATVLIGLCFFGCGEKQSGQGETLSRADSLTDHYLQLQDSIHQTWNIMIKDDNGKIKSMHNLLHELIVSNPGKMEQLRNFEERLEQLSRMRYTQKTMANTNVIEEYDFASNALIVEIIAEAESRKEYAYNPTLQGLVNDILLADQRMMNYRVEYDSIVSVYNQFIEQHMAELQKADESLSLEQKPRFEMVSSD